MGIVASSLLDIFVYNLSNEKIQLFHQCMTSYYHTSKYNLSMNKKERVLPLGIVWQITFSIVLALCDIWRCVFSTDDTRTSGN